ncbi:MAG TPA: DUF5302 domain-containing protein [Propionibacterium sp.]|jgi:hypothetical protein|nr:DUF5302 domain-containing protein [Propionibacterium sp.]
MTSTGDDKDTPATAEPVDAKEAMRQALERKRGASQHPHGRSDHHRDGSGGKAHGPAGGRREFRRKAGG